MTDNGGYVPSRDVNHDGGTYTASPNLAFAFALKCNAGSEWKKLLAVVDESADRPVKDDKGPGKGYIQ